MKCTHVYKRNVFSRSIIIPVHVLQATGPSLAGVRPGSMRPHDDVRVKFQLIYSYLVSFPQICFTIMITITSHATSNLLMEFNHKSLLQDNSFVDTHYHN